MGRSRKICKRGDDYSIAGCEREPMDVVCRHAGTREARLLPMSVHQALRRYLKAHLAIAPRRYLKAHLAIAPRRDGREVALDLPRTVFSQDAVLARGDPSEAPTTPWIGEDEVGMVRQRGDYAFHLFLRHKSAFRPPTGTTRSPKPLGQLSQRPPAGAVRRGDQLEVEGL